MSETDQDLSSGLAGVTGWEVYIILCSDNTLYTGITTDLERRFHQHASGQGAKYFRGRRPLRVVYHESGHNRRSAAKREVAIKALPRVEKIALISAVEKFKNYPFTNVNFLDVGQSPDGG
jgi:putative endonuclease